MMQRKMKPEIIQELEEILDELFTPVPKINLDEVKKKEVVKK